MSTTPMDLAIAWQLHFDYDDEMRSNYEAIARALKEQETELLNTATNTEIAILLQQEEVIAATDEARSLQLAWQLQEGPDLQQATNEDIWPCEHLVVDDDITISNDITIPNDMSSGLAYHLFDLQDTPLETACSAHDHPCAEALRQQMERSEEANNAVIAQLIQQEEAELAEARSVSLALQLLEEEELRRRPRNNRGRSTTHHGFGSRPNHQRCTAAAQMNSILARSASRPLLFPREVVHPRLRHVVPDFNQGPFVNNFNYEESIFQGISPDMAGLMMNNTSQDQNVNDYEFLLSLSDSLGSVTAGLSNQDADLLPSRKCTAQSTPRGSCSICLIDYSAGEDLCTLPCAHIFHKHCAYQWLQQKANCPVCRSDVQVKHN